jgi:hypothetical protein
MLLVLAAGAARAGQQDAVQPDGGSLRGVFGEGHRVLGTVTAIRGDQIAVRDLEGRSFTVFYSANTRFAQSAASAREAGAPRSMTPIEPGELRAGDVVAAAGEVDTSKLTVGAVAVVRLDPATVKRMEQARADYGKTWLAGRVSAIDDLRITLEGVAGSGTRTFVVDEDTAFRRHREPITLGDIRVGDQLRAEGALKDGVFRAAAVTVMEQRAAGGPGAASREPPGEPPRP